MNSATDAPVPAFNSPDNFSQTSAANSGNPVAASSTITSFGGSSYSNHGGAEKQEKHFSPLVTQFLEYLKHEKHFSDYTVKSYGADLIQFGGFLMGEIGTSHSTRPATVVGETPVN